MSDPRGSAFWIFYPDYSAENPFQTMVYRGFPEPWRVGAADIATARLALSQGASPVVFHLHWEDYIYRPAAERDGAEAMIAGFLAQLDDFIAAGGRFVWTVHNEEPHEPRFPGLDADLRLALASRAHAVHMHSRAAAEVMAPSLCIDPSAVLIVEIGGYAGYYPDDVTRDQARSYFGIPQTAPVFASLGSARSYKGGDTLLEAFSLARHALPDARLILAGKPLGAPLPHRFVYPAEGVIAIPRYADDTAVQYVMRAADYAPFAFRRVMVSSSVLLAMTFGVPPIVPDLPTLSEMVENGTSGLVFQSGDARALASAMVSAARLPAERRQAMSLACLDEIRRRDWAAYQAALNAAAVLS